MHEAEETFKKTVTVARSLGMVNLEHISSDGTKTKIKANASNNYTLSKGGIEKRASGKVLNSAAVNNIEQYALVSL
ncbi:MAG: hypothetical protein J7J01_08120 [Methanophagales archaeon]|nr:hypothetical protein [Methanophagales archaeon]